MQINKHKPERINKAWGWEDVIVNNDEYCGKILHFYKDAEFSTHFHLKKAETFFLQNGVISLLIIDTDTGTEKIINLSEGECFNVKRGLPHRIIAHEESDVFEFSTPHEDSDSYRVAPGDSQKKKPVTLKPFRELQNEEPIDFFKYGEPIKGTLSRGCIGTAWCPQCKQVIKGTCLCALVCDIHGPIMRMKCPDGVHSVRQTGYKEADERCKQFWLNGMEVAFYVEGQGWLETGQHKDLIAKGVMAKKA